jgi:hypothetical protein
MGLESNFYKKENKNKEVKILNDSIKRLEKVLEVTTDEKEREKIKAAISELEQKKLTIDIKRHTGQEVSLGVYQPALDSLILSGKQNELILNEEKLKSFKSENQDLTNYLSKEASIPGIQEQINHLKESIEKAVAEDNTSMSKETLDKAITQLRGYEQTLELIKKELNDEYNNTPNIESNIKKLNELENRIKRDKEELGIIMKLHESNESNQTPNDIKTDIKTRLN